MLHFDVVFTILQDPVWSAIPAQMFVLNQSVDIDLFDYLDVTAGVVITRKAGTDQFPPDLMIVDGRYLRGTVSESFMERTIQLTATRGSAIIDSSSFSVTFTTSETPLWTRADGVTALWTRKDGSALWTR